MKNQKGITLVALVVTIVVLLILAGASIAMLTGDNGIITNAQKSTAANTEGEVMDKVKMAYNTISTEVLVKSSVDASYTGTDYMVDLTNSVIADLGGTSEVDDSTTEVEFDGYTVSYSGSVISITYEDNTFGGGNTDYTNIQYAFTVAATKVTISTNYTSQIN